MRKQAATTIEQVPGARLASSLKPTSLRAVYEAFATVLTQSYSQSDSFEKLKNKEESRR